MQALPDLEADSCIKWLSVLSCRHAPQPVIAVCETTLFAVGAWFILDFTSSIAMLDCLH